MSSVEPSFSYFLLTLSDTIGFHLGHHHLLHSMANHDPAHVFQADHVRLASSHLGSTDPDHLIDTLFDHERTDTLPRTADTPYTDRYILGNYH